MSLFDSGIRRRAHQDVIQTQMQVRYYDSKIKLHKELKPIPEGFYSTNESQL